MGAWKYRIWASHAINRDAIEIRGTRVAKNVDVTEKGQKIVTYQTEYAWYDPGAMGFCWKPCQEMDVIKPFLIISGEEFLSIEKDEAEELMSALLPYRVDLERKKGQWNDELLPTLYS